MCSHLTSTATSGVSLLALSFGALLACITAPSVQAQNVELRLSTARALVDEPIKLAVSELTQGDTVRVRAVTFDQKSLPWTAEATFVASTDGNLDLAVAAPQSGTYTEADAMGLFWSASRMAVRIETTMLAAGNEVARLDYEEAGHLLFWDYLPTTITEKQGHIFGGSASANAHARADSWPRIQEFLRTSLREH